jgi:exopolysaccharide biosynthesis protein
MFKGTSDVGATINNPRTAIGFTDDERIILFVCEGRNKTPDTPGFTLEETAKILLDLGCVEAINLDGGGSSCMLVNGRETIKPSDGTQRTITSAVVLK